MNMKRTLVTRVPLVEIALACLLLVGACGPGNDESQGGEQRDAEIEQALREAALNPTSDAYVTLSLLYHKRAQYQDCIEMCKRAIELDPKNAVAYNNMCSAYVTMGEIEKAIAACTRALEIDPNFELARNNLAWASSEKERVK